MHLSVSNESRVAHIHVQLPQSAKFCLPLSVLSERPAPAGAPAGTILRIASCILAFSTRGKRALGPL